MVTRRVAWGVALVAMLTMSVSFGDRSTLAVLAPSVTAALGITESGYGLLTAAFSVAYLLSTPLAGRWIDRVGARRGLVASVLVWSTVAALHGLTPSFAALIALRIALGIAEGPSFPGAAQTMQRILPARDRPRGFGVVFIGSSIGSMLAPPIASALFRLAGWRLAFLGSAAVGMLWIPLWILVTRRPAVAAQLDAPGPAPDRTPAPSFRQLVAHPAIGRALLGMLAVAPGVGFLTAWGAKFLVHTFGVTQGRVGGYLWLPPLVADAGALLFGDLAARSRRASGASPVVPFALAAGLAALLALLPVAGTPWQAMAIAAVSLAGAAGMYTLVTADLLARMPSASVSAAAGVLAGGQSLAFIASSLLIGPAIDRAGGYAGVSIALGLWVLPGAIVWSLWKPREDRRAER